MRAATVSYSEPRIKVPSERSSWIPVSVSGDSQLLARCVDLGYTDDSGARQSCRALVIFIHLSTHTLLTGDMDLHMKHVLLERFDRQRGMFAFIGAAILFTSFALAAQVAPPASMAGAAVAGSDKSAGLCARLSVADFSLRDTALGGDLEASLAASYDALERGNGRASIKELDAMKRDLAGLMRTDPLRAARFFREKGELHRVIARTAPGCAPREEVVEGTIALLHGDVENEDRSLDQLEIHTDKGERLILHTTALSDRAKEILVPGKRARIQGKVLDSEILVEDGIDAIDPAPAAPAKSSILSVPTAEAAILDSMGPQRTLVLLAYFSNTAKPGASPAGFEKTIFSASNSVNAYFKENGYERTSLYGEVRGWYQLPIAQNCNTFQVLQEAMNAANAEVNFLEYSRILVIAPFSGTGCSWAGLAYVGKISLSTPDGPIRAGVAWTKASPTSFVIGHELGHTFGAHHSNFLHCGSVSIQADQSKCSVLEYGDQWSVMGKPRLMHMSAAHKEYIGWLNSSEAPTVTTSGTYTIEPLETNTGGVKAIKLRRSPSDNLFVEFRQYLGFDKAVASTSNIFFGATLHNGSYAPNLIDATPPTSSAAPAILVGGTLRDPMTGATITVRDATTSALTVDVAIGKTDFVAPESLAITAPDRATTLSGTVTLTASASDMGSGIEKVEYYKYWSGVLPILIGTATVAPYSVPFDTTLAPNGIVYIQAKAYDASGVAFGAVGNVKTSVAAWSVSNTDTILPRATWSSPRAESFVRNPVTLQASVSDNKGIHRVEYVLNSSVLSGTRIYTSLASPFRISTTLAEGQYSASARAYDFVGNLATTTVVNFTVDATLPTVAITAPTTTVPTATSVAIDAIASDNTGVTQVKFYAGSTLLCSDTVAPYMCTWTTPATTGTSVILKAIATDKAGNTATVTRTVTVQ